MIMRLPEMKAKDMTWSTSMSLSLVKPAGTAARASSEAWRSAHASSAILSVLALEAMAEVERGNLSLKVGAGGGGGRRC
jgi:hypothetical protein